MTQLDKTIGFIGAGNMADAMIGATVRAGLFTPGQITASDISSERRQWMRATHGITAVGDNLEVAGTCDIVVLSVKPQMMTRVLEPVAAGIIATDFDRKLVISIAAGIRLERIEDLLYPSLPQNRRRQLPIIRVMPNTPALVLAGMSGMSPNRHADDRDIAVTREILNAMGQVRQFSETDLDGVTALSGSGPAYVFYFIEHMIRAGVDLGFEPEAAAELARATFTGALKLLEETGEDPAVLRRKVTSPGGTTEAAIRVLDENRVDRHIADAVAAAAHRSKELSG